MPKRPNLLSRLLIPRYDEMSLFLMSIAFVLLFFTDAELRTRSHELLLSESALTRYLFLLFFVAGLLLSLYHVFTKRRKNTPEKIAMLVFAVMVNGLSGVAAGVHMLEHSRGILMVFPIWNIVNGGLLLLMLRFDIIDESSIVDDNAAPVQLVLGGLVVVAALIVCRFVFELYWAVTFSICVAYATNLNRAVQSVFAARAEKCEEHNKSAGSH